MSYLDLAIANETIKTTDIKGKDYAEVNQRIKAFRMVYPTGFIISHLVSNENGICIFKAEVGYYVEHNTIVEDKNNKMFQDSYLEKVILGIGTAYEKEDSSFINKTSYIENCETSAVGRALGMAGFGIDVSVASAEEVQNAIANQEPTQEEADNYTLTFGKHKGKKLNELPKDYIEWMLGNSNDERMKKLIALATGIVEPSPEEQKERIDMINNILKLCDEKNVDPEEVLEKFKVDSLSDMTTEQMKKCITALLKKE
jgi:uncharacterized protein (DUF3820 family)